MTAPPSGSQVTSLGRRSQSQPNAARDAIGKIQGHQLKVSVTAAPIAGRATDHMVRFLATKFGVKPGDIEVVFGRFNVNKQLRIRAPRKLPAVIAKHLRQRSGAGRIT